MPRLVGRRLLAALPVLFIVSLLTFGVTLLVPGDPAVTLAGENATPEQVDQTRERLGLNDPIYVQYGRWLGGALQGDLGESLYDQRPVVDSILERVPVTFGLAVLAVLFAAALAIPSGVISATRRGSIWDRAITLVSSAGVAIPNYFLGMLLILLFAFGLGWLPAVGYVPFTESPGDWFLHLLLPALCLGVAGWAEITRQIRSAMIQELEQDYARTATAKGLRRRAVIFKHAAKNASVPAITVTGLQVAYLFGGTVIIERMFGIPGLGQFAISAVYVRDIPVIQGVVIVATVVVIVTNLIVDTLYPLLNPKVRPA
ncbi:ABC transporter permease [Acrocarpospora macrocephala]|uniref:ABC di/oligopeptide transporter inner membrane subunit n=1 Tax=Acrocarpospora macrocephala TaxID=150177 RepID=A0A5M3WT78_9ACTN|nr:ABC transporter permease [Acrocarpospora macrocephala]GES09368.1 ABC di/oligopeptide transporter inner membrane subunit [Acrocarpospora macrocephala]